MGNPTLNRGRGGGGQGEKGADEQRPKHTKVINVAMSISNGDPLSVALLSNLPKKICR